MAKFLDEKAQIRKQKLHPSTHGQGILESGLKLSPFCIIELEYLYLLTTMV
jgi:hypothetical protein